MDDIEKIKLQKGKNLTEQQGLKSEYRKFNEGDLVVLPSGRPAKIHKIASRRGDKLEFASLTYTDTEKLDRVELSIKYLKLQ